MCSVTGPDGGPRSEALSSAPKTAVHREGAGAGDPAPDRWTRAGWEKPGLPGSSADPRAEWAGISRDSPRDARALSRRGCAGSWSARPADGTVAAPVTPLALPMGRPLAGISDPAGADRLRRRSGRRRHGSARLPAPAAPRPPTPCCRTASPPPSAPSMPAPCIVRGVGPHHSHPAAVSTLLSGPTATGSAGSPAHPDRGGRRGPQR